MLLAQIKKSTNQNCARTSIFYWEQKDPEGSDVQLGTNAAPLGKLPAKLNVPAGTTNPLTISVTPARFRTTRRVPAVQLLRENSDFLIPSILFDLYLIPGMVLAITSSGITLADPIPKASV